MLTGSGVTAPPATTVSSSSLPLRLSRLPFSTSLYTHGRTPRIQLKDLFGLERHRAKTLSGLLATLAAKSAVYPCGQFLNTPGQTAGSTGLALSLSNCAAAV